MSSRPTLFIIYVFMLTSCLSKNETNNSEWVDLSNDNSFKNWHTFQSDSVVGWKIENGVYVLYPNVGDKNNGLVSNKSYSSFILSLEWKVEENGNSGIFWGVNESSKFSVPYLSAPEIQVIDDNIYGSQDTSNFHHMNGALYDMVSPSELYANATGEWNHYLIEINYNNNIANIDLNGKRSISFPLYGDKWEELIYNSKFKDWEGFAKLKSGPIALQDHGTKVYYRNIKIKEL